VQGIGPASGGLAVNALGLALVAPSLGLGQLLGKPAGPTAGLQTIFVARDRNGLQPQIDTAGFVRCNGFFRVHLDRQA
jgi:hypothetical protein